MIVFKYFSKTVKKLFGGQRQPLLQLKQYNLHHGYQIYHILPPFSPSVLMTDIINQIQTWPQSSSQS